MIFSCDDTPLCPAGHLPHKGGDWLEAKQCHDSISPLVGEMAGRPEGGSAPNTDTAISRIFP
ncbi:hypothetical protein HNQ66_004580 [Shinella fusca]|jgi:hypothetical protein|uniref:Lytic murein transglycosylase n=1 Tax=Shinella fusca TaxID=544480 RepID=A0A7W8DWW3_9HYPH|nr:hypothetical protein [Shinella fusca]